jgi:hypothetical protein
LSINAIRGFSKQKYSYFDTRRIDTRKGFFNFVMMPKRGLRRPAIPLKRKKFFYCSRLCLGFDSLFGWQR